jgi:antitoxin ParD1/3/4
MNVTLSAKTEAWIRQQLAAGRYTSEAELVAAAIELLAAWESGELGKLEALRRDIAVGLAEEEAGYDDRLDIDRIEAEGRRLLEADRHRA